MSTSENIHIIGQGTYGCVYKPHFDCKTYKPKSGESDIFLSKIQLENNTTENEIKIGKIVRSIPKSRNYFAPIEEDCSITIGKINDAGIEKCKMLEKLEKKEKKGRLKSTKVSYVGKYTLLDYLESELINTKKDNRTNVDNYLRRIVNTHLYLLNSIKLLYIKKIIHMDLKHNNIMCNKKPIIIDFGISYDANNLTLENYKKTTIPFGIKASFYIPWCIEIVLLSNISHDIFKHNSESIEKKINESVNQKDILYLKKIVEEYIKLHVFLQDNNLFTKTEREEFTEKMNKYIEEFNGKTWRDVWNTLTSSAATWDNYSINIMYLMELKISGLLDISKLPENTNNFLFLYINIIKKNIISKPQERQQPDATQVEIKKIFEKIKKEEYYKVKHSLKSVLGTSKEKLQKERAIMNTNTLNEEAVMIKKYNKVVQEKPKD